MTNLPIGTGPNDELTAAIKAEAASLGFTMTSVCAVVDAPGIDGFQRWLDAGYAGEMKYLADRKQAYEHPRHVLENARSLVMLAMNYQTAPPESTPAGSGRIARYAWGVADYHDLIHDRLKQLKRFVLAQRPEAEVRGVVDTAPLLEREYAQLAGLGWIGKNTLLLNRTEGSYFFLAALLTDLELTPNTETATNHCGTCTACLDACPTDAFAEPYVLDATKCISYLTIELRSPVPRELRAGVGDWLFGCDVCQEVCPWNRRAPVTNQPEFQPKENSNPIELLDLLNLNDDEFRSRFRRTPLWRSKRKGVLRNAAMVLGNQRFQAAEPALARLLNDDEPLVRGACAWALGEIATASALSALRGRQMIESVASVQDEIRWALNPREQRSAT